MHDVMAGDHSLLYIHSYRLNTMTSHLEFQVFTSVDS